MKRPERKLASSLRGCSKWVLAAVAAAAAAHFRDSPSFRGVDWTGALLVDSARDGGLSFRQVRDLPTWSLREVARAAAGRSGAGEGSVRFRNLMAEFARRRSERLAKEAVEEAAHASS